MAKGIVYAKHWSIFFISSLALVVFFNEYLLYYIVIRQCQWPSLDPHKTNSTSGQERSVQVIFIADTHLLGPRRGHWFDKLRREWQMYRAFQTSMSIHKPDIVFILGDLFDEGHWCSGQEFDEYIARFHSIFSVPKDTSLFVVAGNHDIGFHYAITPYLNERFINKMKTPSVRRVSVKGTHFVLINSMALEGDGCFLCRPTEIAVNKIAKQLQCAKGTYERGECLKSNVPISSYSRPILLQHYPLYRPSDEMCNEPDQAPDDIRAIKFRERWECLSREASEQLLDILNPRLVVNGHTHYGCQRIHQDDILEVTIPSFSWRNIDNPSFLMGVFLPNNFSVSKCYMPVESTVILIYVTSTIFLILYLVAKCSRRRKSYCRLFNIR